MTSPNFVVIGLQIRKLNRRGAESVLDPEKPGLFRVEAWFLLDHKGIVKSCDSSWFQLIVMTLITTLNKNLMEIASDLQPKGFLS